MLLAKKKAVIYGAVERHMDEVLQETGSIDISFNVIGIAYVQGAPLAFLDRKGSGCYALTEISMVFQLRGLRAPA